MTPKLPGGALATRPLHFFFIADCSGSMAGDKIQSLNHAIHEALPHMREVAKGNPNARVFVRAIRFASGAQWHVAQETEVESFQWPDLQAGGTTDMGHAMSLLGDALKVSAMGERALPPVLVLLSDGEPTDDFDGKLAGLMKEPWAKKAVRLAVAIGEGANKEVLKRFMAPTELEPLQANNAQDLVNFIRWASTAVLKAASAPASQTPGATTVANVPLPPPPEPTPGAQQVW